MAQMGQVESNTLLFNKAEQYSDCVKTHQMI